MTDRRTEIRNAYKQTGGHASFYDGMMTYSTFPGKAICRIVWNMDGDTNAAYLERALSGVPEGFNRKLLEVPVGTGVLTMPVYRSLPGADITCLDYSPDMMAAAQARAERMGIGNARFVRGDVHSFQSCSLCLGWPPIRVFASRIALCWEPASYSAVRTWLAFPSLYSYQPLRLLCS